MPYMVMYYDEMMFPRAWGLADDPQDARAEASYQATLYEEETGRRLPNIGEPVEVGAMRGGRDAARPRVEPAERDDGGEEELFKCTDPKCPGRTYKASEYPHHGCRP